MLTVTAEQLSALQSILQQEFETRAAARLAEVFPEYIARLKEAGGGDPAVLEFVRNVVKRAEPLGLERQRDLVCFIAMLIVNAELQGADVGFFAFARLLLDRPDTTGHMKMAMVLQRLDTLRASSPVAERACRSLQAAAQGF